MHIKEQLELIVSKVGVPILSQGKTDNYLYCVAKGMIQNVCVMYRRGVYQSVTADKIIIHPSSSMSKEKAQYIVAGEIVRTGRMYAMYVSSLSRETIKSIAPSLLAYERFNKDDMRMKDAGKNERTRSNRKVFRKKKSSFNRRKPKNR